MNSEIAEKTERLQQMLAAENFDGVLLNAQHNFAWLTGGKLNGINSGIENGACFLLVRRDGKKFVLANNIEMPRLLSEEISAEDFEPVEFDWRDEKSSGDFVINKARSLLSKNQNLASDLSLNASIIPVENLIALCRYELTAEEIKRYKLLGKDASAAIENLFAVINPGETETEIARKAKDALAAFDINPAVILVGADERVGKFRHPIPTRNRWEKTLLIAVCAKRAGLIVNLSRIACAGKIPGELQRRTEATAYVFAKLLSATKIGTIGAKLYRIAADAYAERNFADEINLHHQGGATGYKTREWVAHPKSQEIARRNQAFAWNPSITGTKSEETFITTEDGFEMITEPSKFPLIDFEINGSQIVSAGVLSV